MAINLFGSAYLGPHFRPPKEPFLFIDYTQEIPSTIHINIRALCNHNTKIKILNYWLSEGTPERIGLKLSAKEEAGKSKDGKILLNRTVTPKIGMRLRITAKDIYAEENGELFFDYAYRTCDGSGVGLLKAPIVRNWEAVSEFKDMQNRQLVSCLNQFGYPPF